MKNGLMKIAEDTIICLVGESGSGKSTIAKALEGEHYNVIHSYTTRPQREINEWGHLFVAEALLQEHQGIPGYIVAYKHYDNNHYWAVRDQYHGKGVSIYVVDPDGVEMLRRNVADAAIVIIYLKVDKEERIFRMQDQGRSMLDVGRRVGYDREAFKRLRCDWVVDANNSAENVIELVRQIIQSLGDLECTGGQHGY
jgi:guanylate kinase